ncbi:hypothetical protein [Mediterraneibacter massiliensis]|nr:hypothetical protein [Mediterraneibacter massiliensis]
MCTFLTEELAASAVDKVLTFMYRNGKIYNRRVQIYQASTKR